MDHTVFPELPVKLVLQVLKGQADPREKLGLWAKVATMAQLVLVGPQVLSALPEMKVVPEHLDPLVRLVPQDP